MKTGVVPPQNPKQTPLVSSMIPMHPWNRWVRGSLIVALATTVLFLLVIQPYTNANIFLGFLPLIIAANIISVVAVITMLHQGSFRCKNCGNIQKREETQDLSERCTQCAGHTFLRTWRYPRWIQGVTIVMTVAALITLALFIASLITPTPFVLYSLAMSAGVWLLTHSILDLRSQISNHVLQKGSDMIRTLRCVSCGTVK